MRIRCNTRVCERPRQGLHLRPLVGAVPEVEHVAAFNDALVKFRCHNAPANDGVAGIAALGDLAPSQGAGDLQRIWSCKEVFVQLGVRRNSNGLTNGHVGQAGSAAKIEHVYSALLAAAGRLPSDMKRQNCINECIFQSNHFTRTRRHLHQSYQIKVDGGGAGAEVGAGPGGGSGLHERVGHTRRKSDMNSHITILAPPASEHCNVSTRTCTENVKCQVRHFY